MTQTAKEKALELCQKFGMTGLTEKQTDNYTLELSLSKQCALIAVNEILEHIEEIKDINYHFGKSIAYWKDVKEEIQKL